MTRTRPSLENEKKAKKKKDMKNKKPIPQRSRAFPLILYIRDLTPLLLLTQDQ